MKHVRVVIITLRVVIITLRVVSHTLLRTQVQDSNLETREKSIVASGARGGVSGEFQKMGHILIHVTRTDTVQRHPTDQCITATRGV